MIRSYSFSQNTLFLLISYIVEKLLVFFYFIFLARYLGPHNFGVYSFAISFVSIFFVFVDFGFSTVLIREAAKDKDNSRKYLETALAFKIIAWLITSMFIILIINLLNYPQSTRYFVYILISWMFFESMGSTVYAFFRSQHNMRYEALGLILNKTIFVILGFVFIFLKLPLIVFATPLTLGGMFYFFYPLFIVRKNYSLEFKIDKKILSFFFKIALPLVFGTIFATIFSSINTVLVSSLSSDRAAGLFSAAFRIPMALLFLPGAVGASIFPVFSSLAQNNRERLAEIFEKALFYMIFLSLPLILGGLILSPQIITFIYGSGFFEANKPFSFLILILLFLFLDFLFSPLLTAFNKQRENAIFRGIGLAVNIILCFLLIPSLAQIGGAIAFSVGFSIFSIIQLILILKLVPLNFSRIVKKTILVLISTIIMGAVIFVLKDKFHIILSLVVGAVGYALSLYLVGAVRKEDISEMRLLVKSSLKKEESTGVVEKLQEPEL